MNKETAASTEELRGKESREREKDLSLIHI